MKNKSAAIPYRIVTQSCIARLAALKLGTARVAIVLGSKIYLYGVSKEDFLQNPTWLRHELCHIQQFKRYGFWNFICRYLWETLKKGYHHNKYEVEARAAEWEE